MLSPLRHFSTAFLAKVVCAENKEALQGMLEGLSFSAPSATGFRPSLMDYAPKDQPSGATFDLAYCAFDIHASRIRDCAAKNVTALPISRFTPPRSPRRARYRRRGFLVAAEGFHYGAPVFSPPIADL